MAGEPTFTPVVNPSYPYEYSEEPKVLVTQYGDGYIERAGHGLNAQARDFSLKWEGLTLTEVNSLVTFFRARKGYEAFLWTPVDEATAIKCICQTWKPSKDDADNWNLTAQFKQVFDL